MKTSTAIALGAVAGTIILANEYSKGIDRLVFSLSVSSIRPLNNGDWEISLYVQNPNRAFAYPVPRLDIGIFDSNDNYLGTVSNFNLQWIYKNSVSVLVGYIKPNYGTLIGLLSNLIASGTIPHLILQGYLYINRLALPINKDIKPTTNGL